MVRGVLEYLYLGNKPFARSIEEGVDVYAFLEFQYFNYPHTANNSLVVVVTCLLYVQYSRVFLRYSRVGGGLSWAQKSFFIQCSSICTANLIAALIYVYMQFFKTPSYFVLIGHMCWQLGHGEST
ncbi:hypothetical protein ANCDUO_02000 [Ancylostoma duodenale]|uniref:Uncharacterized protein n=1 Tax=Ancylostoma duodenale TaxID=51022 RepID=A0A0C2DCS4_9BILA|nr:hypothetical protein ANCDUO_02000 [Ancylostoma duodenale]